jgi:hypothetical protein
MTTRITVTPHGHNVEVVITENGVETVNTPDPHSSTDYYVYDSKTVMVREIDGWAEKLE